ncbi:MAG: DUF1800 family protein [Acidobacteriota bacterium]
MLAFHHGRTTIVLAALSLSLTTALAQTPPEVTAVRFSNKTTLAWDSAAGAARYNIYRGVVSQLAAGVPATCHVSDVAGTSATTPNLPASGVGYFYLVTGESATSQEGTPGNRSSGAQRSLMGRCDPVIRQNVLDRITYGRNDYVNGRVAALGLQGFVNEQLTPTSISEADNAPLNALLALYNPVDEITDLIYNQLGRSHYARRQLEQVATQFWANHFSTDWGQVFEGLFEVGLVDNQDQRSPSELQNRELGKFRTRAFTGTFREILEDSAFSPAMVLYLDGNRNIIGVPQENYARELMELHTLGVDGGYTQEDVRQMALVWTGWTVCRKTNATINDPLAPCNFLGGGPWATHFDFTNHDCRAKTLFAGTPQQVNIPSTCNGTGGPTSAGLNDTTYALDAVADHPATKHFISKKLLQKFVTETPSEAQIQTLITEWDATGGDLKALLAKAIDGAFNPDNAGNKIKMPFETVVGAMRMARSDMNQFNIVGAYLQISALKNLPHLFPAPTGYSELGTGWINTNDLLERQNWAFAVANDPLYSSHIIELLAAAGLTAASPPASVADFILDTIVGGRVTPAERQLVIEMLTTNDVGAAIPMDNVRIKEAFGFVLGLAPYVEQ